MNDKDTIYRQAAIDALNDEFTITGKTNAVIVQDYIRRVHLRLHDLPSAEPERKTGQWLPSRDRDYNECSCCHRITEPQVVAYKFCPYCGAEMTN